MDGLTTCCTFAGVSGLSVVEVTPRQSIASVALTLVPLALWYQPLATWCQSYLLNA
ncbi:hypothetical protein Hanom_Chr07g00617931 [Helianthus anomalus]